MTEVPHNASSARTAPLPATPAGSDPTRQLAQGSGPTLPSFSGPDNRPQRLGKYLLQGELGRGGMGVVYRAIDESLDRPVALKVISPHMVAQPEAVARLVSEARAAARLTHPHIVTVYAFGEEGGLAYIAMEYVEGMDVAARIARGGPIAPQEVFTIARQAAEALDYASAHHIVHRDIKPSNIFIASTGVAKVMDFGLAKQTNSDASMSLTATGNVVGTPNYMAPEQAMGSGVDFRADMYSLGCTMFTMLSGRKPFESTTPLEVMMKHVNERLDLPREWKSLGNGGLIPVLERLTAKRPQDRFATWKEAIAALKALEEGVRPAVPSRTSGFPLVPVLAVGGVALALLVVGGAIATRRAKHTGNAGAASVAPVVAAAQPTASVPPTPGPTPTEAPEVRADLEKKALEQLRAANAWDAPPDPGAGGVAPTPASQPQGEAKGVLGLADAFAERLKAAGANYAEVTRLAREARFEEARALLDSRPPVSGPPVVVRARRRLDATLERVERAYSLAQEFDTRVRESQKLPADAPPKERAEAVLRIVRSQGSTISPESLFGASIYLVALDDPNAHEVVQLTKERAHDLLMTPGRGDVFRELLVFYGYEDPDSGPQLPEMGGGPNGGGPGGGGPQRRPMR